MHPNAAFRHPDQALLDSLIVQIGFGMVFAQTPDGPRVAHVALLPTGDGAVQFHLARGNALTKHLAQSTALIVINGPDGYVSPRWYAATEQVPTWNYVAVELEGRVRRLEAEATLALVADLSDKFEARIAAGQPWTMDKLPPARQRSLLAGIVGFEMEIQAWRETVKLSQNKDSAERERLAQGLESEGNPAIAHLMRTLAS